MNTQRVMTNFFLISWVKLTAHPKHPEWAESICQIKAAKIREIAHLVAKNPSLLLTGWSMQRADHGEQPPWMFVTLASMVGQIGLPGRGYSMGQNYPDGGSIYGMAPSRPLYRLW